MQLGNFVSWYLWSRFAGRKDYPSGIALGPLHLFMMWKPLIHDYNDSIEKEVNTTTSLSETSS